MTKDKKCVINNNKCDNGYILNGACIPCPENCRYCGYHILKQEVECYSFYCSEVEKLGNTYSCVSCNESQALVEDIDTKIKYCYNRRRRLNYCFEGIMKVPIPKNDPTYRQNTCQDPPTQFSYNCTKCVDNAHLNELKTCDCNYDSFDNEYGQNLGTFCRKCNDFRFGNPGCDKDKGCTYYYPNDQLNCNCVEGYFDYDNTHQCFKCSIGIQNCDKCHYDYQENEKGKLICDKCNDNYILNKEKNKCIEEEDCEEYPNISPGCIICKDKLNEYVQNKKCQKCKFGYFKTRNE